jgi:hypothetical protein
MRFVCKHDDYTHQINAGTVEFHRSQDGATFAVPTSPHLVARFKRGLLTAGEREAARMFFDARGTGAYGGEQPGAQRYDGVFGIGLEGSLTEGLGDSDYFTGSKWEFMYSLFDTADENECPPEYRDAYEAVLSADAAACKLASEKHGFLGKNALNPSTDVRAGELVRVDTLMVGKTVIEAPESQAGVVVTAAAPVSPNFPWKTYDEMAGAGIAQKIVETVDLIGLDRKLVAEYEMAHKARGAIVAKLLDVTAKEAAAAIKEFKSRAVAPDVAPMPTVNSLTPDQPAPRQLDGVPDEAMTDGIRFSDFSRPAA